MGTDASVSEEAEDLCQHRSSSSSFCSRVIASGVTVDEREKDAIQHRASAVSWRGTRQGSVVYSEMKASRFDFRVLTKNEGCRQICMSELT